MPHDIISQAAAAGSQGKDKTFPVTDIQTAKQVGGGSGKTRVPATPAPAMNLPLETVAFLWHSPGI